MRSAVSKPSLKNPYVTASCERHLSNFSLSPYKSQMLRQSRSSINLAPCLYAILRPFEKQCSALSDCEWIADMFRQANDIFRLRKSGRCSLHRVSPVAGTQVLVRSVCSSRTHQPAARENTFQTIALRLPALCSNLPESRQYLPQSILAESSPIRAKCDSWLDSGQTHALRRVQLQR